MGHLIGDWAIAQESFEGAFSPGVSREPKKHLRPSLKVDVLIEEGTRYAREACGALCEGLVSSGWLVEHSYASWFKGFFFFSRFEGEMFSISRRTGEMKTSPDFIFKALWLHSQIQNIFSKGPQPDIWISR